MQDERNMTLRLLCPPLLYYPRQLAEDEDLGCELTKFLEICKPPEDLRCLYLVISRLHDAFRVLPSFEDIEPFKGWPRLFNSLENHRYEVVRLCGRQVLAGLAQRHLSMRTKKGHPLYRQIEEAPLFAMLCSAHKLLPKEFGALQLQILHAHWRKVEAFKADHPDHVGEIREGRRKNTGGSRDIKMSNTAARTVRAVLHEDLEEWLRDVDTTRDPDIFLKELDDHRPPDKELRPFHDRIACYCVPGYEPGSGGSGGGRKRSIQNYLCAYSEGRFGIFSPRQEEIKKGEREPDLEHLTSRRLRGKVSGRTLTVKEISKLGISPLELVEEDPTVLASAEGSGARQGAQELAIARTRSFEIDRRLFPWNSQAMRTEEFHRHILPHLKRMSRNVGPSDREHIVAGAVVAVMAETGRNLNEVLRLTIDPKLSSEFSYRPPDTSAGEICGRWKWDSISPPYESEFKNEGKFAVDPENYLVYPASVIVTKIIERYLPFRKESKSKRLFPFKGLHSAVRNYLDEYDAYDHFTPTRITNLGWGILHELTGGELASICLLLGLHRPLAQVELFYAILETSEAASLFAESQKKLWGEATPDAMTTASGTATGNRQFVGCRAFPHMERVKETIDWLREGSEKFFSMRLPYFKKERDSEILNRAVMYATWHQFFAFGTRAICDAFQKSDKFSDDSGIGVLSDKDFITGYKTRIIFAPPRLRRHMRALERRLVELLELQPTLRPFDDSSEKQDKFPPVWLLDTAHQCVELKPSTIDEVMKEKFPLPVNSPRKVMRFLLRIAGMSHTHAEAFMGHWWHGREPFSPFSSFAFCNFIARLRELMPDLLEKKLGFDRTPGSR
jgi:hypothetical protein